MKRTLLSLVGILLFSATIAMAQKPIPVAFLGVEDESGYGGSVFKEQVAEILVEALSATQVFLVQNLHGKVSTPINPQTFESIAEGMKVSAVAQATVKGVLIQKLKRDPKVTVILEAQIIPVKATQVVFKASAKSEGDDPAEGRAVAKALSKAAAEVAKQLSTIVAMKGQVLLPPVYAILPSTHYKDRDQLYERTVRISLDMTSGIKVGSEVVILKQGNPVATGRVVEVDIGSSLVALTKVQTGIQIRTGDEVRVTSIPQYANKLPLPLQKEREYKRVEHDFAWALAIAGVAIGLTTAD